MKILHLAPLWFPIAPDAQGGRESVLGTLIPALEAIGCRNTVIGTADSNVPCEVIPVADVNIFAQMRAGTATEYVHYEQRELWLAFKRAHEFDVIHSHLSPAAYSLSALDGIGPKVLHTHHNPISADIEWIVGKQPDMWLSAVSESQARRLRGAGATRCEVVHNAIDVRTFQFGATPGENLVFLGRIDGGKGADRAVQVARELDMPMLLAGPMTDDGFFDKEIKPYLNDRIRYIGAVDHKQRNELLAAAKCVVLPFRLEEGFGMVTVEAGACGAPVVALARGAVPEVVEPGVTGYLTNDEEAISSLVLKAFELDRRTIRQRIAARFDLNVAAAKYRDLYQRIISANSQ